MVQEYIRGVGHFLGLARVLLDILCMSCNALGGFIWEDNSISKTSRVRITLLQSLSKHSRKISEGEYAGATAAPPRLGEQHPQPCGASMPAGEPHGQRCRHPSVAHGHQCSSDQRARAASLDRPHHTPAVAPFPPSLASFAPRAD